MKWKYQVGVFDMHIMHIIPYIYHTFWLHRLHISKFPGCVRCHVTWHPWSDRPFQLQAHQEHRLTTRRPGTEGGNRPAQLLRNVATLPSKVHCFRSIQKLDEFARSQGDPKVQITWWFRDFMGFLSLGGWPNLKKNDLFREHHQIPEGALKWYWLTHRIKLEEMTGDDMSS